MTTDAAVDTLPSRTIDAPRPAIRNAALVVATAGGLGLLGQLLFFEVGFGINIPIALTLLLIAGWLLRHRGRPPAPLDAWLAPAAIAFAAFVAIRADPVIQFLDVITALALGGAALASFAGRRVVSRSLGSVVSLGVGAVAWLVTGAAPALADARREATSRPSTTRPDMPAMPILRGLIVAIPLLLIFIALFASADAVFAELLDDLVGWDLDVGDGLGRLVLASVIAWLAAGGLAFAAVRPHPDPAPSADDRSGWRPGTTELVTVLVAVCLVFVAFVALQAAYLFGGLDTLEATGLTYAEYARRGFFELVAVAVLAGGLVIGAERIARERTGLLVGMGIALSVLTAVVLASAFLRLRLYQDAYGWTELRLYVLATIVLLGIALAGLVATLLADRVRWMGHLLIVSGLAIGMVLNVIGPVRFITEQNVARALDPSLVPEHGSSGLDVGYAYGLGIDAIPALVRALPALRGDEERSLRFALEEAYRTLRTDPGLSAWQAWNAGNASALDALAAARASGDLP